MATLEGARKQHVWELLTVLPAQSSLYSSAFNFYHSSISAWGEKGEKKKLSKCHWFGLEDCSERDVLIVKLWGIPQYGFEKYYGSKNIALEFF